MQPYRTFPDAELTYLLTYFKTQQGDVKTAIHAGLTVADYAASLIPTAATPPGPVPVPPPLPTFKEEEIQEYGLEEVVKHLHAMYDARQGIAALPPIPWKDFLKVLLGEVLKWLATSI